MEGLKVSFDSIQYFYHKYQNSDSYEERLQIVLDLIQVEEKYACYFEIDEEELAVNFISAPPKTSLAFTLKFVVASFPSAIVKVTADSPAISKCLLG